MKKLAGSRINHLYYCKIYRSYDILISGYFNSELYSYEIGHFGIWIEIGLGKSII